MYAVIEDSGSQFRVSEGDVLNVDLRELAEGAKEVEFARVLLVGGEQVKVGTPYVQGAKVLAEVVDPNAKGPKIFVFHMRRRKNVRRRIGHRQKYIQVRVKQIVA